MTITIHRDLEQGSDAWHDLRRGTLTAGSTKFIMTPTGKRADNDKTRAHLWELLAQRITGFTEPSYLGEEMERGFRDEIIARDLYRENFAPVEEVGHITNDEFGFTMGYSPDGLVGDDGMIEIKSRRQRFMIEQLTTGEVPDEFMPQMQAGMMIAGRLWCDFCVICGGLPFAPIRVHADPSWQARILEAATAFEMQLRAREVEYRARIGALGDRAVPTERIVEMEMFVG